MSQVKHVLAAGILVALTAGVAALAILSSVAQTLAQSSGQNGDNATGNADQSMPMMQNNDDMMPNTSSLTMMGGMSMFATNSLSMVDGVRITGMNIEDNDEISVNLKYTGTGNAPRVTLVAMTASTTGTMNMMMTQHHGQMMNMNNNMDMMAMNTGQGNSSMQSSMMSMHDGVQSGSNVLDSGWESPSTVTIKLEGSSAVSEDEIGHIMVMIFPFAE